MKLRPGRLAAAALTLAAASSARDARACGGCFAPPPPQSQQESQSTVVTGHRMAFAISTAQTTLWDQIQYSGSPTDFAWVLPVRSGAVLELSTDAWFETLDAATSAQVLSPQYECVYPYTPAAPPSGGGCCGSSAGTGSTGTSGAGGGSSSYATGGGGGPPPVTVTHEATVGPYQTVTLHANVPNALPAWLAANGYKLDPSVAPIIDAYTSAGFDFIALRLAPGESVHAMQPVRVVTQGGSPTLPLRMVAAGTGPNVTITLFVIGEGRWETQNFPHAAVDPTTLVWDFTTSSSNYAQTRLALMAQGSGRTWNDAYAAGGVLLEPDGVGGQILVAGRPYYTVADAYVARGVLDGDTNDTSCRTSLDAVGTSNELVSGACLGQGSGGGTGGSASGAGGSAAGKGGSGAGGGSTCAVPPGDIDARELACGPLDDIAVALVGMHPDSVWLGRLEANLPHAALATDLNLEAASAQKPVSNVFQTTKHTGDPCPGGTYVQLGTASPPGVPRPGALRTRLALAAFALAALGAALGRRRRRATARSAA